MYEGKHIHYSQTDQKPLCSFSGKICNQRRLNNYGFCVRHILEDTTAPFKRCAYVAKSSRQTCTQPIPKTEEREYCNNHMQVLGMLPKKERKPKNSKASSAQFPNVHVGAMSDPGLLQNKLKPKLTAGSVKEKLTGNRFLSPSNDTDDVYAFPADNNDKQSKNFTALIQNVGKVSVVGPGNSNYGAVSSKTVNDASSGQSSLAKIYPELAEKLEKIKPKVEAAKVKGKVRSSRTMNSLQTKIAQNKIKDKLKRNQSSSNTSSQSQSPSHSFMSSSPGYHINTSSPNHVTQSAGIVPPVHSSVHIKEEPSIVSVSQPTHASNQTSASTLPCLSGLNLLNGLNLQTLNLSLEQLGLPVPTVSDIEQTLKQLAKAANIPLDGSTLSDERTIQGVIKSEAPVTTTLPPLLMSPIPTFTPQSGPPPPYPGVHHKTMATVQHTAAMQSSPVKQNTPMGHQIVPLTTQMSSHSTAVPQIARQFVPASSQSSTSLSVPTTSTSALSSSLATMSIPASFSTFPNDMHPKLTLLTSSQSSTASNATAKSQEPVKQAPSTVAVQQQAKPKPAKSKPRSRNPSSGTKRPVPLFSLPMTVVKPRKLRKVLDENEVKTLKKKSAIELYNKSMKRKIDHHYMIYSGVASSDESDVSDCELLPWQQDWLTPSSDEEAGEDEESDYTLRTAKLALGRARRRRQCFQARWSSKGQSFLNDTTCLIKAARDSAKSTVKCLLEVKCAKKEFIDRYKKRGTEKRRCLYKDNDEVQCKNTIVPYTNHCIKHVMYNVDQQLFEYCTAKFADNTQCCHPVIDVKHELPLCMEHGLKADNFLKAQDGEPKPKKPRKKTKPSALTRPPKKGKKKKNQRKTVRPQNTLPVDDTAGDTDVVESAEEMQSQHDSEAKNDSDSDKGEKPISIKEEIKEELLPVPPETPVEVKPDLVVADSVKKVIVKQETPVVKDGTKSVKTGSVGQLEELENLTGLSELENVKMFGDLETTASKLLEENDFQDVFNKLPDEAFDLFKYKGSTLPSTDELQDLEDSLALANRELNSNKSSVTGLTTAVTSTRPSGSQPRTNAAPILEDADDLTRQIAEEVLKQNIGTNNAAMGDSICNGDAEESIKAIARSLSNTGMMLAAEAKQKSQKLETSSYNTQTTPFSNHSVTRSATLPAYNTLEYFPPNVAIQNLPLTSSSGVGLLQGSVISNKTPIQISQVFAGQGQSHVIPQNVTVTPQGLITSHVPTTSSRQTSLSPYTQTVTIGNTTVTGNQSAGIITLPSPQQLTAQQLSALVQQAAAQLPPLPPYKPRQHRVSTTPASSHTIPHTGPTPIIAIDSTQRPLAALTTGQRPLAVSTSASGSISQDLVVQQLTKQQEQLLAQQLLQQKLATLAPQTLGPQTIRVTLPSTQNLGFSTILQHGQIGRLNQGIVQAVPNIGQITQLIKTDFPTSQTLSTPISLPTTNIVWTSPPNVTITCPNGLPRAATQSKTTGNKIPGHLSSVPSVSIPIKETFIDLTESDPPPYEATQSVLAKTHPPPSYPTHTTTNTTVTGKS